MEDKVVMMKVTLIRLLLTVKSTFDRNTFDWLIPNGSKVGIEWKSESVLHYLIKRQTIDRLSTLYSCSPFFSLFLWLTLLFSSILSFSSFLFNIFFSSLFFQFFSLFQRFNQRWKPLKYPRSLKFTLNKV